MTRSQRPRSARTRIVTGVVLACAVALALVGGVTFTVQAAALWRAGTPLDGLLIPMIVFGVASVVTIALVALVGWFVAGAALRSIAEVREVADSMTLADLSRRLPSEGGDSIADLSQTVNSMLDRLEGSVDSQRQLLDDVRHELKTPITIVRGHLEIMNASDPADVEATRAIGMAELDRLNRLVEDIDLLAAAETDTYASDEIDLAALSTRMADMVAVIPGHDWRVTDRASGLMLGDGDRLLQAWLQLADNASKYSPDASPIDIGSTADAGEVRFWVRDHGPGVPPAMRHRIFRRFDRAGRRRSVGGSGLGLAIVDAIAKGHGGHCEVTDTPGGGATFTIHVPHTSGASYPAPVRADDVIHQGGKR
ncbi:HAMP domain-containing sensor histidine kinase [Microbacterium sp.]|uniref:sensor histidine kinase n=1 Tax=Microbacterium sp. TaxID=51671 RepID=UPI00262B924B|nr:HAMP domain-containing sensor histidine kinase [Microbacterium sp.]